LPYGATDVAVAVQDENLLGFLAPLEESASNRLEEVVRTALAGKNLFEAARQAKRIVIAFQGKSGACTSAANLLAMQLSDQGLENIELLEEAWDPTIPLSGAMRTDGSIQPLHMPTRHDPRGSQAAKVGQLDDGSEILLNETFANADVRCVISDVAVNPFWGYSGGPSFVVPGLASERTIKTCLTPCLKAERLPGALSGNPTYEKLLHASQLTRIDFAVHLVEHPDGRVAGAFAGDFMGTFQQACTLAGKLFRPSLRRKADIVISSAGGAPWDRSLFEASPSALVAANICKDHGIVILVAECSEGLGRFPSGGLGGVESKARLAHARRFFSLDILLEHSLRRVSGDHRVYLVSTLPEHQASLYGLLDAKSVRSALERAIRHAGKEAKIALVPYGSHTAPMIEQDYETSQMQFIS